MECPNCLEEMDYTDVPVDRFNPEKDDGHSQSLVRVYFCPECGYEVEAEDAFEDNSWTNDEKDYLDDLENDIVDKE